MYTVYTNGHAAAMTLPDNHFERESYESPAPEGKYDTAAIHPKKPATPAAEPLTLPYGR